MFRTVLLLFILGLLTPAQSVNPWAWRCTTGKCVKERKVAGSIGQLDLEACKITCGVYGSLLPYPKNVLLADTTNPFSPKNITKGVINCLEGVCPLIDEAFEIFKQSVIQYHPSKTVVPGTDDPFNAPAPEEKLVVDISIDSATEQLLLSTNESYTLTVTTEGAAVKAIIQAPTYFGARHALETLAQLIDYDEEFNSLQIVSQATISDEPKYKYRGVIIDTSRNFIPVEQMKKIIDGMSYNKLNSFHWHITDSQSFPMYMKSALNMSLFGAYSQRDVYQPEDVAELVRYAKVRGIRMIPELDAPAHSAHGWEWGPEAGLGNLVVCLDKQPWNDFCAGPPCGQLNIANENIYPIISKIYQDMIAAFGPLEMFHYGGDEIFLNCWNSTEEIVSWMKAKGSNLSANAYFEEWNNFQERVYQLFTKANNGAAIPGIMWTSELTHAERVEKYLSKDKYIIQVWTKANDPTITDLLAKGYKIIMSNYDKLYFDCGFSSWVSEGNNWCSPYKGWQGIYTNDLSVISQRAFDQVAEGQVLGGEAALWSEQIDANTIDARLWPRASAHAEMLWSEPKISYRAAESRMLEQRRRMVLRGINAERLQPEWCRQNTGECGSEEWIAES